MLPSAQHVETQRHVYNGLITGLGGLVFLIGVLGSMGYLFQIPLLSTFTLSATMPVTWPISLSLIALGVAVPTILAGQHDEADDRLWLRPVRYASLLIPGAIGLFYVARYLFIAHFDPILPFAQNFAGISAPFLPALCSLIAAVSLSTFWFMQRSGTSVVFMMCIPALLLFNFSYFSTIGHIFAIPILFNFGMSVPGGAGFCLLSLAMLIAMIPYRGLLIPLASPDLRPRLLSYGVLFAGLVIMVYGASAIAIAQYYKPTTLTWAAAQRLYALAELITIGIDTLIITIGLRAIYYYSESLFYAREQAARTRQLEAFAKLNNIALMGLSLTDFLNHTVQLMTVTLDLHYSKIIEYLPGSDTPLFFRAVAGFNTALVGDAFDPGGEPHAAYTLEAREPVVVEDIYQETRFKPSPLHYEYGLISGMATVIYYANGKAYGVLEVDSTAKRQFTRQEVAFLQSVADLVGLVVERKQAEAALVESEERFRTLADQSPMQVNIANPDARVIYFNKFWLEYTGQTFEEAIDKGWEQIIHPDDLEPLLNGYLTATQARKSYTLEARMRRWDGEYRYFLCSGGPQYASNGVFNGYIGIGIDIHNRKVAEHALLENQLKLAESNRDLEQFAAVASHDLQAPLRKIQIFTTQVYQEAQTKLSAESLDLMLRIDRAVKMAQQLVTDILALAKVTQTSQPFTQVDLSLLVDKVLVNLDEQIKEQHAQVEVEPLVTIMGDPAQLEQLVQNLIENALKYQPEGQRPVIRISSDCLPPQFCELVIEDNGIGFSAEQAERIFQPFERLHGKTSRYKGTGVGLAICKRIAERHHGSITAESAPGAGAKFIVRFPYQDSSEDKIPSFQAITEPLD